MGFPTKIVTCCFCGSKAALKLDKGRHELACASCGAPLSDMKMLPKAEEPAQTGIDHAVLRRFPQGPAAAKPQKPKKPSKKSYRKKSRRKSWFKEAAEELFDLVEDIFD